MIYSFFTCVRPKSYNSKNKDRAVSYQHHLAAAFRQQYPSHTPVSSELYGLVYHFYRQSIGIDADNLSKPVWDAMKEIIYIDDRQIKLRLAGSFDLITNDFATLDISGLPGLLGASLIEAISSGSNEHVIYVECGTFTTDIVKLNLQGNGN